MKKKLLALALAATLALSLVACGKAPAAPAEPAAEPAAPTTERTTFTIGFDAEYPPYGYMDESGAYVGFDIDLAKEVCTRNGWEFKAQPLDWASKDMELNAGNIDCIWNGFTMTGREADYTFSAPYVDNSIVFVVKADSGITVAADLAGKNVVTQSGSSALTALTDAGENGSNDENLALAKSFAALEQTPDYNSAFMNLESGVVDAIAVDVGVANYQLESRKDLFTMLEKPLSTEQYGIGFKLGNEELRDAVQASLYEMLDDGTFAKIAETWGLSDMVCLSK
ncbi:MAG: amino acid ABC transporter substrate-binding protein [Oscillospiraceae bacterium]